MASETSFVARARTDARDFLVEADEPLAGLQLRNAGELPGPIIAPALLELVRKARAYRFRIAGPVQARDGDDRISAWVEVEPDRDGQGCVLAISNWRSEPVPQISADAEAERDVALLRQAAELTARLGPQQELLFAASDSPDLQPLLERMRAGIGLPWSDYVNVEGKGQDSPLHWRLLDGAKLKVTESQRQWSAHLVPHGRPVTGSNGFELLLVPDRALAEEPTAPVVAPPPPRQSHGIGSDIAPVLRQPVARIIANAETIRSQLAGPLGEEYSAYAADISAAGEHLLALIEDLATLEVVEGEDFRPEPAEIDLAELARRAAGILGMRARERRIFLVVSDADDAVPAIGDARRVLQILLNLLGNAIRYSPEGTEVKLRVKLKNGRARVTVVDRGPGLDEDEQLRVFDKFERLGRSGDGGSGLGLYISRRLAEAMGGSLVVKSEKAKGSRFILSLPAREA